MTIADLLGASCFVGDILSGFVVTVVLHDIHIEVDPRYLLNIEDEGSEVVTEV